MDSNPYDLAHRPLSVVRAWSSYSGIVGFVGALLFFPLLKLNRFISLEIFLILCTTLPVLLINLLWDRVYLNPSTGLEWATKKKFVWSRIFLKIFGIHVIWGIFAFCYWCFPEYNADFYHDFFKLALRVLPFLSVSSFFYIAFIDKHMTDPEDSLYDWALFLIGKANPKKYDVIVQYFLGWCVKGFFLPFIGGALLGNLAGLGEQRDLLVTGTFVDYVKFCMMFLFGLDVLYGTVGYLMTFRLLDTHIRSTEPTFLGWSVALVCYPPFNIIWNAFAFHDDDIWYNFIPIVPLVAQMMWAGVVLVLVGIYVWATVIFGLRFSNLTNRGIITNGPYRFFKHPAYLSKNLFWWLCAVPFVQTGGISFGIKACIGLLLINFIYYLRGKTEERHLLHDPHYQQYTKWMEQHGVFYVVKRYIFSKYTKLIYEYKKL